MVATRVTTRRWDAGRALGGGAVAGIIAGLVLTAFILVMTFLAGGDLWMALKGAGTPFLGERAAQPGFDAQAVAIGVLSHLGVSMVWGILFGALFYGISRGSTVIMGILWGVVVWLGMYYVVLPVVGLEEIAQKSPVLRAILSHMGFGLVLALAFLPFQRRIVRPMRPRLETPGPSDRTVSGPADRPVY